MCRETLAASPSTQPSSALMLHEYRYPRNIARHAEVSPFTSCYMWSSLLTIYIIGWV